MPESFECVQLTNSSGKKYYWNRRSGKTVWNQPGAEHKMRRETSVSGTFFLCQSVIFPSSSCWVMSPSLFDSGCMVLPFTEPCCRRSHVFLMKVGSVPGDNLCISMFSVIHGSKLDTGAHHYFRC